MHRRKTHTLLQLYMHSYTYMYGDVPIMKHAMYYNIGYFRFLHYFLVKGLRALPPPLSSHCGAKFEPWTPYCVRMYVCTYIHMYVRV